MIPLNEPAPIDGEALDRITLDTAEATRDFGQRLGSVLLPGDVLVLTGGLGAGKTTLTQGIGEGLQVRGPITSPTFVIAREHPSLREGPSLVHVDAYRLGSSGADPRAELDDLDLDTDLESAVTVIEWGGELAQALSGNLLTITLSADEESESRLALLTTTGDRWAGPAGRADLLHAIAGIA